MTKKIGIITSPRWWPSSSPNAARLVKEAKKMRMAADLFFSDQFSFKLGKGIKVYYQGKSLDIKKYSVFLPIMAKLDDDIILLKILEAAGAKLRNKYQSIAMACNKTITSATLAAYKIPTVASAVIFSPSQYREILKYLDKKEVIYKLAKGSMGKEVAYLNTPASICSSLELFDGAGIKLSQITFQKFIREAKGQDIRVIIVGHKVVAAIRKIARLGDFRSNVDSGSGRKVKINKKMEELALAASKALGLDYCGVDIIISKKGPLVLEVNSNSSLDFEKESGVNIARQILLNVIK